jgi:hypothetical protein
MEVLLALFYINGANGTSSMYSLPMQCLEICVPQNWPYNFKIAKTFAEKDSKLRKPSSGQRRPSLLSLYNRYRDLLHDKTPHIFLLST